MFNNPLVRGAMLGAALLYFMSKGRKRKGAWMKGAMYGAGGAFLASRAGVSIPGVTAPLALPSPARK